MGFMAWSWVALPPVTVGKLEQVHAVLPKSKPWQREWKSCQMGSLCIMSMGWLGEASCCFTFPDSSEFVSIDENHGLSAQRTECWRELG
jgi:hypothetical protein